MHLDCSIIRLQPVKVGMYVLFSTNFWADISSNFDSHEYHSVDDVILQRICMVYLPSRTWQFNRVIHRTAYVQVHSSHGFHSHIVNKLNYRPQQNTDVIDLDYTVRDQSQASDWVLVLNSTGIWKYAGGAGAYHGLLNLKCVTWCVQ